MRLTHIALAVAVLATLSGCQRSGFGGMMPMRGPQADPLTQPQPINPAPVGGVQSSDLSEPGQSPVDTDANAPTAAGGNQVATGSGQAVTKEELIGRWTLSSSGQSCDIFLSLTKWTGGFRAASRGCSGSMALIAAWDVKGSRVVLADSAGSMVAQLFKTASERYDGSAAGGVGVSLSR